MVGLERKGKVAEWGNTGQSDPGVKKPSQMQKRQQEGRVSMSAEEPL